MSTNNLKVSAIGEAEYPHLQVPDTKFQSEGEYKCNLKVKLDEATEMIADIENELNQHHDQLCKDKNKKSLRKNLPFTIEDGYATFKFKVKASGKNTKTNETFQRRITVIDSNKKPLDENTRIWGGSTLKIAYNMRTWFTDALGVGIQLQPKAVQVINLVTSELNKSSSLTDLFEETDGFTQDEHDNQELIQSAKGDF